MRVTLFLICRELLFMPHFLTNQWRHTHQHPHCEHHRGKEYRIGETDSSKVGRAVMPDHHQITHTYQRRSELR